MAKSNHLFKLLLCALICIHFGFAGNIVERPEPQARDQDRFRGYKTNPIDKTLSAVRLKVKQTYDSQIGVREAGANSGPDVEKYLRYAGLPKGNPWCAAFVCWVLGEAGVKNPGSGWSPALFGASKVVWKRGSGTMSREREPPKRVSFLPSPASPATFLTGDVFGIYFPDKKRIAHAGFIDQWDGSWLVTVEGNTNGSGDREGDGVYRKRRPLRTIYQVARYIN